MGKIRVLPDEVASQVAAGEVVERPASLVKELVENSLDAGAGRIWVDYQRGGTRFVSVRDDGCGMDREDALLCLERHATSKIRTGHDLAAVATMGFRGEALPSIASVSRFRLVTREHAAPGGVEITVAGGRVEDVREVGASPGTQIEVRDLFYNLPARRKFLRSEETEAAHIFHGLEVIALANPEVAFELRRDGKVAASWPQAKGLDVRIRDLFGAEFLKRLAAIEPEEAEGVRISGFLAKPGQGRRDRLQQFVIINGRPIVSPPIQQALREAYADALPRGEHPLAVLIVEIDPDLVDCNVHPAKREVRLRRPDALRAAVYDAARQVLVRRVPPPSPTEPVVSAPAPVSRPLVEQRPAPVHFVPPVPSPPVFAVRPAVQELAMPLVERVEKPETESPYRIIGALRPGYLLLEGEEGLVVLDERAARERILFEQLLRGIESGEAPCQHLLIPAVCELPPKEFIWVVEHLEDLRAAGFSLEPFGSTTVKVDGLPRGADDAEPERLLHEVAASIRAAGKVLPGKRLREAVARSVCRLAVQSAAGGSPAQLVAGLLKCELPYAGADGRPTMIQFSYGELARKFGRTG